jgi:hypothetical protein
MQKDFRFRAYALREAPQETSATEQNFAPLLRKSSPYIAPINLNGQESEVATQVKGFYVMLRTEPFLNY